MRKEIPILFSTDMVQAILEGRKTQTRRTVKFKEIKQNEYGNWNYEIGNAKRTSSAHNQDKESMNEEYLFGILEFCPYGQKGDVLYVREGYYQLGSWREIPDVKTKGGRMKWEFVSVDDNISFNEPSTYRKGRHHKDPYTVAWHKRLARFMPRKYARIRLEIVNVRVEQLQDISTGDAIAEGIYREWDGVRHWYKSYESFFQNEYAHLYSDLHERTMVKDPVLAFFSLWAKINGRNGIKGFHSFVDNPWVWVVEFKVLSTTGKPNPAPNDERSVATDLQPETEIR